MAGRFATTRKLLRGVIIAVWSLALASVVIAFVLSYLQDPNALPPGANDNPWAQNYYVDPYHEHSPFGHMQTIGLAASEWTPYGRQLRVHLFRDREITLHLARGQATAAYIVPRKQLYTTSTFADQHWVIKYGRRTWMPDMRDPMSSTIYDYDDFEYGYNWATIYYAQLPLWPPLAVVVLPLIPILYRRCRHRQRINYNLCVLCGYNLYGRTQDRCSECGHPVNALRYEKARRRHSRSVRWRQRYLTSRSYRWVCRMCLLMLIPCAAIWYVSYERVSVRYGSFVLRAYWGCFICYWGARPDPSQPVQTEHLHVLGNKGDETMWWPRQFLCPKGKALYIPMWLAMIACVTLWWTAYQPRKQWHGRQRMTDAFGPADESVQL